MMPRCSLTCIGHAQRGQRGPSPATTTKLLRLLKRTPLAHHVRGRALAETPKTGQIRNFPNLLCGSMRASSPAVPPPGGRAQQGRGRGGGSRGPLPLIAALCARMTRCPCRCGYVLAVRTSDHRQHRSACTPSAPTITSIFLPSAPTWISCCPETRPLRRSFARARLVAVCCASLTHRLPSWSRSTR